MLSRIGIGAILIVVLAAALLSAAPARLLALVLPADQVSLQGLDGTVWQGSASRCVLQLPQGNLHLGAIRWSLSPLSLLRLAPQVTLNSQWGAQRINGELVLRGARDVDVRQLEMEVAAQLVQRFAPLAIDGNVSLQVQQLSVRDGLPASANGRMVWQDGGFRSPRGRVPLGTYALQFEQPPGEALRGQVITLAGDLQAEGEVALSGRQYRIDVLVSSAGEFDPQLKQALSLMATPEGPNYRLRLEAGF